MKIKTVQQLNTKISKLKVGERLRLVGLSDILYHSSEGLGSTALKAATKSMADFKDYIDHQKKFSKTQQNTLNLGTALHLGVLEPEKFKTMVITTPPEIKVRRGKEWEKFEAEHAGALILNATELATLNGMIKAVKTHAADFFTGGSAEVSYWYRHHTGIVLKARIDYEIGDGGIDLKSTRHDTPDKFKKAVKYDYDMQECSYRLVSGLEDLIYIGVSKTPRYRVHGCRQGTEVRDAAATKLEDILYAILTALEFQEFPDEPMELVETSFTEYERSQL